MIDIIQLLKFAGRLRGMGLERWPKIVAEALRPAGGDPRLDHLQKYFFDSLCFLEWTWPF